MIVYLVRHGQSHENTLDLRRKVSLEDFQSTLAATVTSPLTELGHEQARAAGTRLQGANLSHIYASPYLRAQQTAAAIAAAAGLDVETVAELHEVMPLLPPVLRRNRQRSLGSLFVRGYLHQIWPRPTSSGETWWAARRRAAQVWATLSAAWQPGASVAIVAHRAFLWTLLRHIDDLPAWQIASRDLSNAGISEVRRV